MNITKITEEVYQIAVNVENILFEGIWEIPNGVSLNSYIVKGEKTAIIDGVCGWDGVPETFYKLLEELDIKPESIEYLIVNHMEPDHSGWIESFKKINSNFKIVCTKMAASLLEGFYQQSENIICVKDKDTLDLGNGHVLTFTQIPGVHWPDTMVTFDTKSGTLFSCDAFGSFGKLEDRKFDDLFTEEELAKYEEDTIRYYSNIVAAFSAHVKKAIQKCAGIPIKLVAPGHGLMWRDVNRIITAYDQYADYQKGPARREITFIWSSMYGMTEKAVKYAINILEQEEIKVHVHQVPQDSWGTILTSAWTSTGIILAMPTYELKMFPPMASIVEEMGKKKIMNRKAFRFGSYGWAPGAQKELLEIHDRLAMNWDFLEQVEFLGSPTDENLEEIGERIRELVKEVKKITE